MASFPQWKRSLPSSVGFSLGLFTILVDIVLVLAPWAAEGRIGPAAQKYLLAMLAQSQGLLIVHQHEAEHHLDTQQQGVKVPINIIQQLHVMAGSNLAKRDHCLAV